MPMFGKQRDQGPVLAEHGRWIAQLRDDGRIGKQRLKTLELRVSALESHLAELTKICNKLDVQILSVSDWLLKLNSKIDAPAEGPKRGRRG